MSDTATKENAPETPRESQTAATEPESHALGKGELLALENAIFRKHIEALTAELAELRSKYDIKADPADTLTEDVRELKAQFAELKTLVQNLPAQMHQQTPVTQPMPQAQPQWLNTAPQTMTIPYISTPSYTPLMPAGTMFR